MSELIDRIPGVDSLKAGLRRLGAEGRAIKSRQRTTGKSGQLGYVIESANDWDLIETFPTTPPFTALYAEYRLTFTGDGTQKWPYVQPATDIRVNGTGEANKLTLSSNGRYRYSSGGNVVQEYYIDSPDPTNFENENALSWIIAFEYVGSVTVRMKARGRGSTKGTWSLVRIA